MDERKHNKMERGKDQWKEERRRETEKLKDEKRKKKREERVKRVWV